MQIVSVSIFVLHYDRGNIISLIANFYWCSKNIAVLFASFPVLLVIYLHSVFNHLWNCCKRHRFRPSDSMPYTGFYSCFV